MSETLQKVVEAVNGENLGEGIKVLSFVLAKVLSQLPENVREGVAEHCFELIRNTIMEQFEDECVAYDRSKEFMK